MRPNSRHIVIGWFAVLVVIAVALGAAAQTPVQSTKDKKPPRNFNVKADLMKVVWGEERKVLLTGNVIFTQEDTRIASDYVEWDRKQETAIFPGKLSITTPEAEATAAKGQAFFKKRVGILEGSVSMIFRPKEEKLVEDKESVQTSMHRETTMTCSKLEYDYKNKIAVATGGVTICQKERTVTADKVVFDQNQELLTLNGNVRVVDDQGQEFNAPGEAKISIKKGQEWIEAPNPTAKFKVDIDE